MDDLPNNLTAAEAASLITIHSQLHTHAGKGLGHAGFSASPPESHPKKRPCLSLTRCADSFSEMRFALAEGSFTKAHLFLVSRDKRSALLEMDMDTILRGNWEIPSITYSLEWQIPEAP